MIATDVMVVQCCIIQLYEISRGDVVKLYNSCGVSAIYPGEYGVRK
jgi:hypothetical protein